MEGSQQNDEQVTICRIGASNVPDPQSVDRFGILAWGRQLTHEETTSRADVLRRELEEADPETKAIFSAQKSGVPLGIARVARDIQNIRVWWLLGLAVHPDRWRHGVATRLVEACLNYARTRGGASFRNTHRQRSICQVSRSLWFQERRAVHSV